MKPFGIFLFSFIIVIVLVAIAIVFPKDGITIHEDFSLNFYSLERNLDTVIAEKSIEVVLKEQIDIDTIPELNLSDSIVVEPVKKDSLLKNIQRIEFGENGKKSLQRFFQKAVNAKRKGNLVRVMHYGDSQIEGDRITSYLRSKMQKKFGGHGVGLVPVVHVADFSFPIRQKLDGKWHRNTLFGRKNKKVQHNEYGALHSYSRFSPILADTVLCDTVLKKARVKFSKSPIAYSNTRTFQKLKVFLKNRKCESRLEVLQADNLMKSFQIDTGDHLQFYTCTFGTAIESCELAFTSFDSPEIHGIALDPVSGIVVDNIALRGSSGDVFTRSHWRSMQSMFSKLDVELFILQFGGNKVPFIEDEAAAKRYGNYFKSQINVLKKMCPNAAIIVIGPADMSKKDQERYVSYEMLVPVRDALKRAAISSGAGFWDMMTAMGGLNSMPGWVSAQPALASEDHIHFTTKGAKVVAQMFYNALIMEYNAMKDLNVTAIVNDVIQKEKNEINTKE